MFSYVAYGLGIHSALPLPELVPMEGAADLVVRLGHVEPVPAAAAAMGRSCRATADEACLFYEQVGTFLVRGGREIIVDAAPDVEEQVLRLGILGPALAVLLHQRGLLILHASAVAVNDWAVAFLGGPGWGKSTTAAALHAQGRAVLADDVTAVHVEGDGPVVFPGFPQLKLWPDAAVSLGHELDTLVRLHPRLEKRAQRVSRGFPHAPLPLRVIYVLADGTRQEVEPVRPQEALVELVRHSYCARLLRAWGASKHFRQCANLVARVPVRRLKTPRSLTTLPALARFVEDDLAHPVC